MLEDLSSEKERKCTRTGTSSLLQLLLVTQSRYPHEVYNWPNETSSHTFSEYMYSTVQVLSKSSLELCSVCSYLNPFHHSMAHSSSNFYRSKSLNAQWEDLSRSVSYVLNEHEGPEPKAEPLRQIISTHWVDSLERTHCADRDCQKKFTLTERKHHCRR